MAYKREGWKGVDFKKRMRKEGCKTPPPQKKGVKIYETG
jgi:hypothetical protein